MISQRPIQPLRFYTSVNEQTFKNTHIQGVKNIISIIAPDNYLLPFQIKTNNITGITLNELTYINNKTGEEIDVKDRVSDINFDIVGATTYIRNFGKIEISDGTIPAGEYYLKISYEDPMATTETYYSELFLVASDVTDMLKITYKHSSDLSSLEFLFQNNFEFYFYVENYLRDTYEYEKEREVITNKNNDKNYIWQKLVSIYETEKIIGRFPIAELFHFVSMHDTIEIEMQNGESSEVKEVEVETAPIEGQEYSEIYMRFKIRNVIISNVEENVDILSNVLEYVDSGNDNLELQSGNELGLLNNSGNVTEFDLLSDIGTGALGYIVRSVTDYSFTFENVRDSISPSVEITNSDLSSGVYTFNHALNLSYPTIRAWQNLDTGNKREINIDNITTLVDSNNVYINFGSVSGTVTIKAYI